MPRGPRTELAGDITHVVSRGVDRQPIFRDHYDRRRFLALLRRLVVTQRWACLTYCLMGNHYHLVIQLQEPNLSVGMQRLNGDYGRAFNDRHSRTGHLFQGRFWSKPVRSDEHMVGLARYLALNPVRANLCPTADRWPWGAHRALIGVAPADFVDVARMLTHFGEHSERARSAYEAAVIGACPEAPNGVDVRLAEALAHQDRSDAIAYARREGYGIDQIAAILGCTAKTIQERIERGQTPSSRAALA